MCLRVSYKKKYEKQIVFASLMSLKKGVGSGVGSGSEAGYIRKRYGSTDPDPHQNVMEPQHCFTIIIIANRCIVLKAVLQFKHLIQIWLFQSLKAAYKL